MERRWRSPARATALGVAVAVAGLAAMPRSASKAQEPDRPSARAALRHKIAEIRGDVELREVEHEAEREILKQKLMRAPIALQGIEELRSELRQVKNVRPVDPGLLPPPPGGLGPEPAPKPGPLDSDKEDFLAAARKIGTPEDALARLAKALEEATKTNDQAALAKAMLKWLEGAEAWSKVEIEKELAPLRKEFARHASELCAKKLELEDLEKQYRESR